VIRLQARLVNVVVRVRRTVPVRVLVRVLDVVVVMAAVGVLVRNPVGVGVRVAV
jgi:hypothetical protein